MTYIYVICILLVIGYKGQDFAPHHVLKFITLTLIQTTNNDICMYNIYRNILIFFRRCCSYSKTCIFRIFSSPRPICVFHLPSLGQNSHDVYIRHSSLGHGFLKIPRPGSDMFSANNDVYIRHSYPSDQNFLVS